MNFRVFLSLLVFVGAAIVQASPKKFHICTITMGSSDEADAFRKNLNPEQFEFTELTEFYGDKPDDTHWLERSCEANVKCDVLIISSEHASNFFQKASMAAAIPPFDYDKMNVLKCKPKCKNTLQDLLVVHLYGCNTLNSRTAVDRSSDRYYDALQNARTSSDATAEALDMHYGQWGQDTLSKAQYVFNNTPIIYGFKSAAPLGKYVGGPLNSYVRSFKGGYFDYLTDVYERRAKGDFDRGVGFYKKRQMIKSYFSHPNFVITSGENFRLPIEDRFSSTSCTLNSESESLAAKLKLLNQLFQTQNPLFHLPDLADLMQGRDIHELSYEEQAEFQQIRNNINLRHLSLDMYASLQTRHLKIRILPLFVQLNWMTREDAVARLKDLIFPLKAVTYMDVRSLCGTLQKYSGLGDSINFEDLPDSKYIDPALAEFLSCLKVKDGRIISQIHRQAVTYHYKNQFDRSITKAFANIMSYRPELLSSYNAMVVGTKISDKIHPQGVSSTNYLHELIGLYEFAGNQESLEALELWEERLLARGELNEEHLRLQEKLQNVHHILKQRLAK